MDSANEKHVLLQRGLPLAEPIHSITPAAINLYGICMEVKALTKTF